MALDPDCHRGHGAGPCPVWSAGAHPPAVVAALLYGLAIVGSAFLLSWSLEVAEMDIPRALAISVLAVVAVLPEYAIDVYLAWSAAYIPENVNLATANMTGANRLLIGIGWSLVVLLYWFKTRKRNLSIGGAASPGTWQFCWSPPCMPSP